MIYTNSLKLINNLINFNILMMFLCYLNELLPINIFNIFLGTILWFKINIKTSKITNKYFQETLLIPDYITSFVHSAFLLILLLLRYIIHSNYYDHNILLFTLCYFIYDIGIIILNNHKLIFIAHHLLSIISILITLQESHIINITLNLLLIAEISNPFQNAWQILKRIDHQDQNFYYTLFSNLFVIQRLIIFPMFMYNNFVFKYNINNIVYYTIISFGHMINIYWSYLIIKK